MLREEQLAKGGNNGQIFVEDGGDDESVNIDAIENAANLDDDDDDAINHGDDGGEEDQTPKKERRRREKGAKKKKK